MPGLILADPANNAPQLARRAAAGRRDCGSIRPSTRGRWRALSLILIHVAAALHILHWRLNGRTLTPVEPSEAMETLGQGLVNAGFVLFALLILGTMIFGRFFCGWGCHIVALQDLCTWILKKMRIRPRPFRSRLLVWAPLLAAFYMFVAPTLVRVWVGEEQAAWRAHFYTDDFWGRFPGWFVATLTFAVCGFLIVYLLGNKGFCTYGCPYGGIFALTDKVAPGKIRVTDDCEQCGHCTATCTSNVRVHDEVREHGMVVDVGCMKCMDCVSVCPKDALYFGFGAPTVAAGKPRVEPKPKKYDYTWGEELALAGVFIVTVVIQRALYDAVPLLLALGISAISAWLTLTAARVFYTRDLRSGQFRLRAGGKTTTAGRVYLAATAVWLVFLAHSGYVKYLTFTGTRETSAAQRLIVLRGAGDAEGTGALRASLGVLERAERLGIVAVPNLLARLGSGYSYLGDRERAEGYYRRAAEKAPGFAEPHYELARFALAREDREAAIVALKKAVRAKPDLPGAHGGLTDLLLQAGRPEEALSMLEELIRRRPEEASFRLTYGIVLAQTGEAERGLEQIRAVLEHEPENADAHFNLGQVLAREERFERALRACHFSLELDPTSAERHLFCAKIAGRLSRADAAKAYLDRARRLEPLNPLYVQAWVVAVMETGTLEEEIRRAESARASDQPSRVSLLYLYKAAGRSDDADRVATELGLTSEPATPAPAP